MWKSDRFEDKAVENVEINFLNGEIVDKFFVRVIGD